MGNCSPKENYREVGLVIEFVQRHVALIQNQAMLGKAHMYFNSGRSVTLFAIACLPRSSAKAHAYIAAKRKFQFMNIIKLKYNVEVLLFFKPIL